MRNRRKEGLGCSILLLWCVLGAPWIIGVGGLIKAGYDSYSHWVLGLFGW